MVLAPVVPAIVPVVSAVIVALLLLLLLLVAAGAGASAGPSAPGPVLLVRRLLRLHGPIPAVTSTPVLLLLLPGDTSNVHFNPSEIQHAELRAVRGT